MRKKLIRVEFIGIIFVMILGTLQHFFYKWSGENLFVGLFSPINESAWEHLKLIYFPTVLYLFFELFALKDYRKNIFTGKFLGLLWSMTFIISFFYTFLGIIGKNIGFLNIISFIIAAIGLFLISYLVMNSESDKLKKLNIPSLLGIILIGILFIIFTLNPPDLPLFKVINSIN